MKALVFDKQLKFAENLSIPVPQEGEALVKILMAGVCNTDIELTKGYMGFSGIPGHEFVGLYNNQRVVGEINCACGECEYCKKDLTTHCPNRTTLGIAGRDGCFAEYIALPTKNLHAIPDSISNEEAVFIEPLAAAFQILEQVKIGPEDKVVILGDGKLGLLISLALKLTGAKLTLVGKHVEKLNITRDQGVNTVLLAEFLKIKDYDFVVEVTGTIGGFEMVQELVKPRGTIILKSTVAGDKEINLSRLVIDEVSVIGSRCGPFKPVIVAFEKGFLDVKPLISKVFKFDDALEAFAYSKKRGVLKVLIDFSESAEVSSLPIINIFFRKFTNLHQLLFFSSIWFCSASSSCSASAA